MHWIAGGYSVSLRTVSYPDFFNHYSCLVCAYSDLGVAVHPEKSGSEIITMYGQTGQVPAVAEAATSVDARISLLAEVDFKWLMAGQGCWIDTNRFHSDPAYVAGLLRVALASQSFALRECAASLQAQLSGVTSCDVEGLAPDQSPSRQSSKVASARDHEMR